MSTNLILYRFVAGVLTLATDSILRNVVSMSNSAQETSTLTRRYGLHLLHSQSTISPHPSVETRYQDVL
jgi:hypothetical protein